MLVWCPLGAAEARYSTGVVYLFTSNYLREVIGFRMGMFASAAALASTFSSAIVYGITSSNPYWRVGG